MSRRALVGAALLLASCGNPQQIDPSQQVGPNPILPKPVEHLISAVGVADVVGWKAGETPTVPKGFKIAAIATGLSNPRNVYPLANGDLLVVESQHSGAEPVDRPKDPVRDFIMSLAHGGGGGGSEAGPPPQRITLVRDANGDGKAELKTVLLDHLNSPFGIAVVGNSCTSPTPTPSSAIPSLSGRQKSQIRGRRSSIFPPA